MKNDVSHHGILLNLIFAQFCRIFLGKTGFRIRKTGYPIHKFICVKTYLGQGKYYLKISAKFLFLDFLKNWIRDPDFFGLKPPCDQDGANKKRLSQISPAVMEEIGCKHTYMLANKHCVAISLLYSNTMFACLYVCMLVPYLLRNSWTIIRHLRMPSLYLL